MTSALLQDDTEALVALFNKADSGPSPWGISTHGDWVECGRRASLRAAERAAKAEEADAPQAENEDGDASALKVGIYFHKLMEGRILRQLGTDLVWDARAEAFNVNFLEAIRLYREYHRVWGSVEERWGCRVVGAEIPLGMSGDVPSPVVVSRLGGPLTGRMDAVIEVVAPEKALANTGLVLMPGRYILDWKTGKAHSSSDEAKFVHGLQAQAYLWLDTVEHGEGGALGMVFDRIVSHKVITREKSYAAFVAYPQMDSEERLRAMVQLSMRSQANPMPNPLACPGQFGRQCWFKTSGQCKGY